MSNDQNPIDSEYSPLDTLIINLKSDVIQEKDLYPEQKEQLAILYGENWMFLLGLRPFSEIPVGSSAWNEIMVYKRDNK